MKIITNYNELKVGDIVAVEYELKGGLFNCVGEIRGKDSDSISIQTSDHYIFYSFNYDSDYARTIKTLALLCPVDEKLHLGDVWERKDGEEFLIGAYFLDNTWVCYKYKPGEIGVYLSKADLETLGYKLRTTPREVTMDEVREKFGEDIIIKK